MNETAAHIRTALPNDAASIAQIARQARAAAMPWLPVLHTKAEDQAFYAQLISPKTEDIVLVAEANNTLSGFIIYNTQWLDHLYIHPDSWNRGLGAALLGHAKSYSNNLQLWVFERNLLARKFYQKHGFLEEEQTDGNSNEEKCPDIRMRWR